MKKPHPALVLGVMVPFLGGCFTVGLRPIPEPAARSSADVRGVVLRGSGEGERVQFERVDHIEWTDSTLTLIGALRASSGAERTGSAATTRLFPLSSLSGVLMRQVDVNRTSIVIGAVAVSVIAIAAFALTGKTDESTVLGVTGRD